MFKQVLLTGMVELTAFGILASAFALWAVALAPLR
ncbi:hypothetical protein OCOJLMKI_2279 [Methylobacterium iners]|jgi:hypothetical protein|uniref:Uncharacterized protein n=1 Tax=Methylobacterium iners TaxID=418707 RepID=A0ABQ4RZY2_9HYPH|nr:hypothetical protein OCOJLMKI_2279 [Methylobacterium iners]